MKYFNLVLAGTLLLLITNTYSQSFSGISGLMIIPNTEIASGQIKIGAYYFNTNQIDYSTHLEYDHKNVFVYYSSIGFLPFLEFSIRGMKVGAPGEALGDRMVSAKVKVLSDTLFYPSICFGIHDFHFSSNTNFHVSYAIISKKLNLLNGINFIAGYGFKLFNSVGTQLNGLFYGVNVSVLPNDGLNLFFENDNENFNSGVKLTFWKTVSAQIGVYDMKFPFYGICYSYQL